MRVVAVASGRGGVGKSVLTANLALALSQQGKKVLVVDLDLGSPSLHLILSQNATINGLAHFFSNEKVALSDIIQPSIYRNLSLISGVGELENAAHIQQEKMGYLFAQLRQTEYDYLFLDLSAGTRADTLDAFVFADQQIIATTPAITAATGAYLFLKNSVFRLLATQLNPLEPASQYFRELRTQGVELQKIHLLKFERYLTQLDPQFQQKLKKNTLKPYLVINMVHEPKDLLRSYKLCQTSKNYLGIEIHYLGQMAFEEKQRRAIEQRQPLLELYPETKMAQGIRRIAHKLLNSDPKKEGSYYLQRSFQLAEREALADKKLHY